MKLRTPPTGAPRRAPCGAAGSDLGSSLRSLSRLAGESVSPVMSLTWADRSRTAPCASTRPGFSAPGAPKRTSFMGLPSSRAGASPRGQGVRYPVASGSRKSRGAGQDFLRPRRTRSAACCPCPAGENRTRPSINSVDKWRADAVGAVQTAGCRCKPRSGLQGRPEITNLSEQDHHHVDACTDERRHSAR